MRGPNIVVLRELQQTLPAAKKLFAALAEQTDQTDWITVDELIDALELGRRNAVDLLRALAEADAGEFRLGRKGHPSRLVWSTDPRQLVARVLARDTKPSEPEPTIEPASEFRSASVDHVFVLRPELRIHLSLPSDLSSREAAALGDWVRNLSFER